MVLSDSEFGRFRIWLTGAEVNSSILRFSDFNTTLLKSFQVIATVRRLWRLFPQALTRNFQLGTTIVYQTNMIKIIFFLVKKIHFGRFDQVSGGGDTSSPRVAQQNVHLV